MEKVKYGIIGVGHMGKFHLNVLKRMDDVELIGIFDNDEKVLKEISDQYKVKPFDSIAELLKKTQAVTIATPTSSHYDISKLSLNNNVHILVEKPITEALSQAEDLINIAKDKNLVLNVGHVERFNGAVQELSNIVKNPKLWESRRLGPNIGRIKDVGVILDLMIHDIDICLRTIKSKVVNVTAQGISLNGDEYEDMASTQITFENECVAIITVSRLTQEKVRTLSISQEDCYILLDFTTQDLQLHRQASSSISSSMEKLHYRQESLIERVFIHKENPLQSEIQYFVDCIKKGESSYESNKLDLSTLEITNQILSLIKNKK